MLVFLLESSSDLLRFGLPSASPPFVFLAMASESVESYLKAVLQPLATDLTKDILSTLPEAG